MVRGQKANYENTIIYKLVCNHLNITDFYIGSTTNFIKRKYHHKSNCYNEKCKEYNYYVYNFIRNNGGWENWSMIEICKYPCNDRREAEAEERRQYELLKPTLNTKKPYITEYEILKYHKEYSKDYREENKQEIAEYKKNYYKQRNQKINCECGGNYTVHNKLKHFKTKKHQKYLDNIQT